MSKRDRNNIPGYRRQDLRPERTQEQKPGIGYGTDASGKITEVSIIRPEDSLIQDERNEIREIRTEVEETLEKKNKRRQ